MIYWVRRIDQNNALDLLALLEELAGQFKRNNAAKGIS